MALNIPMPEDMGESFLKGINSGTNMFTRMMQPMLEREKQKQLEEHFKQEMALRNKQFARSGANSDLQRKLLEQQLLEHELKTNPEKLRAFIQQIRQQSAGGSSIPNQPQAMSAPQEQPMNPFEGTGMPSAEEIQNPTAQQVPAMAQQQMPQNTAPAQTNGLFDNLSPEEQMMLSMAGIKVPTVKENPEQKRYAELQGKIQLENYKAQQKKALEQEKASLKNDATRQKTIDAATADYPHLESTLNALEQMEKIANNNPDLFGHSGIMGFGAEGSAERFAKTTNNPNAGAWQTYGLGPIIAAESKMSSKGNQLALKQALANKPNFSESQPVALAKIKANIKQIKQAIKENKALTGKHDNESVIVTDPSGKKFTTTKENAAHLPEGWTHG